MLFRVGSLPVSPVDAAARFYADVLPAILERAAEVDALIVLDPADHTHRAWRTAAVQGLARDNAPRRINAIASSDERAIAAAANYLARAPGVTGQYFVLDADSAGISPGS